jgi:Raf kinase inhibitor-like YbhB/YbcL family protein
MIMKIFLSLVFGLSVLMAITSHLYGIESNNRRNNMKILSPAFQHEGMIPDKFSCKGKDISPPLKWENAPAGAKSFALVCDDPDAPMGTWDHWLLFNIPASVTELPEGIPAQAELPNGARHGKNSWGRKDYGGPCPPGGTHRYFFKFYALDTLLDLKPGASKKELLNAMQGHILAQTELMGKFKR